MKLGWNGRGSGSGLDGRQECNGQRRHMPPPAPRAPAEEGGPPPSMTPARRAAGSAHLQHLAHHAAEQQDEDADLCEPLQAQTGADGWGGGQRAQTPCQGWHGGCWPFRVGRRRCCHGVRVSHPVWLATDLISQALHVWSAGHMCLEVGRQSREHGASFMRAMRTPQLPTTRLCRGQQVQAAMCASNAEQAVLECIPGATACASCRHWSARPHPSTPALWACRCSRMLRPAAGLRPPCSPG